MCLGRAHHSVRQGRVKVQAVGVDGPDWAKGRLNARENVGVLTIPSVKAESCSAGSRASPARLRRSRRRAAFGAEGTESPVPDASPGAAIDWSGRCMQGRYKVTYMLNSPCCLLLRPTRKEVQNKNREPNSYGLNMNIHINININININVNINSNININIARIAPSILLYLIKLFNSNYPVLWASAKRH